MYEEIKLKDHPKLKQAHEFVTKYSDAIIAGGVARDILLDREYNDIDIFLPDPLITTTAYELYGDTFMISEKQKKRDSFPSPFSRNEVDLDIKVLPRSEMTSIEALVEQFDIVMNQAWLEPTVDGFEVHSTNLFELLSKKNIFGYYPDLVNESSEHLQRIYNSFNNKYELLAVAHGATLVEGLANAS